MMGDANTFMDPAHKDAMHHAIVADHQVPNGDVTILASPLGITIDRKGIGLLVGHNTHGRILRILAMPLDGTMMTFVSRTAPDLVNQLKTIMSHSLVISKLSGNKLPNCSLISVDAHLHVTDVFMGNVLGSNALPNSLNTGNVISYAHRDVKESHKVSESRSQPGITIITDDRFDSHDTIAVFVGETIMSPDCTITILFDG